MSSSLSILQGFILGWSVAWPPGPINFEIARRGLSRGFWPAFWVGLGACTGDFAWAVFMSSAVKFVDGDASLKRVLEILSAGLLFFIAFSMGRNWLRLRNVDVIESPTPPPKRFISNGYLLGLALSLTSPWNLTFWLAVVGRAGTLDQSWAGALFLALAVVVGAISWVTFFSVSVAIGRGVFSPSWHRTTELVTAIVMLIFAVQAVFQLFA